MILRRIKRGFGIAVTLLSAVAGTQAVTPASPRLPQRPRYEVRAAHDPDGIGKFYMGREIAHVMGHEAADWLDRPEREQEEQPSRLVQSLPLKKGDAVADVGAGSGYLTFRLAERVGPTGAVFAQDIQPEMLGIIRARTRERGLKNIRTVLGAESDTRLPANSVDLLLLVDVYHELSYPWELTRSMVKALKPGGRLVLVEYRREDPSVPIKLLHKMSEAQVRKEMSVQPLRWEKTSEVLPRQHIFIFQKLPVNRGGKRR
jgi:ubiquinone/menaquinone biosynthesis C-methylase UbiE